MAEKPIFFLIFIAAAFLLPKMVLAADYTSSSFKVIDPVIDAGGLIGATSNSFQESGSLSQISIGTSSSAGFQLKSGFFYFPSVAAAAPAAAAAAGGNYSMYLESLVKLGILPLLPTGVKPCDIAFDLNCDGSIGLKDFSIFLAVQNRPVPNPADFNKDNKIDFRDLSILLSGWTGRLLSFVEPTPSEAFLTGTARTLPFRGEAAIFPLRGISQSETVLKLAPQAPAAENPGFIKNTIKFISNVFNRVIKIFIK